MKLLTIILFFIAVAICPVCAEDIETLKHEVFKDATITRAEPDGIVVSYSGGIVKIPFNELPAEFAKRFGYNEAKAKEFADATDQQQRDLYLQTQGTKEQQRRELEAADRARAAQREQVTAEQRIQASINKTIAEHGLLIGMTAEQCIQSRGEPDKINTTMTAKGRHEQWVYGERPYWRTTFTPGVGGGGTEGWAAIPPSYLYLDNGILTSWQER